MLQLFLGLVLVVAVIWFFVYHLKIEKNKKLLLTASDRIQLETVIAFSNLDLVERLKKYYKKQDKKIMIEYADRKYIELDMKCNHIQLLYQLDSIQDFMVSKRYNPDPEYCVDDFLNSIMHNIWIDYASNTNYYKIFWREIGALYTKGELSVNSYNEVHRRFCKYKYLGNK